MGSLHSRHLLLVTQTQRFRFQIQMIQCARKTKVESALSFVVHHGRGGGRTDFSLASLSQRFRAISRESSESQRLK